MEMDFSKLFIPNSNDFLKKRPDKQEQLDEMKRNVLSMYNNMNNLRMMLIALAQCANIDAVKLIDTLQDQSKAGEYIKQLAAREQEIADELQKKREKEQEELNNDTENKIKGTETLPNDGSGTELAGDQDAPEEPVQV